LQKSFGFGVAVGIHVLELGAKCPFVSRIRIDRVTM